MAGFEQFHGRSASVWFRRQYGSHEVANRLGVIGIALWQNLDQRAAVRSTPITGDFGGNGFGRNPLGLERNTQEVERKPKPRGERVFGARAVGGAAFGEIRQQTGKPSRRISAWPAPVAGRLRNGLRRPRPTPPPRLLRRP